MFLQMQQQQKYLQQIYKFPVQHSIDLSKTLINTIWVNEVCTLERVVASVWFILRAGHQIMAEYWKQ